MSHETEIMELFDIVQKSFKNAVAQPDAARWKSCAQLAGIASCRMGADGDLFRAAALDGVAEEARRQLQAMMPLRRAGASYADDYDMNERTSHLDMMGEFK